MKRNYILPREKHFSTPLKANLKTSPKVYQCCFEVCGSSLVCLRGLGNVMCGRRGWKGGCRQGGWPPPSRPMTHRRRRRLHFGSISPEDRSVLIPRTATRSSFRTDTRSTHLSPLCTPCLQCEENGRDKVRKLDIQPQAEPKLHRRKLVLRHRAAAGLLRDQERSYKP